MHPVFESLDLWDLFRSVTMAGHSQNPTSTNECQVSQNATNIYVNRMSLFSGKVLLMQQTRAVMLLVITLEDVVAVVMASI
jgi:hypothetical protein